MTKEEFIKKYKETVSCSVKELESVVEDFLKSVVVESKEDWWSHDGVLIKEPTEGTEYFLDAVAGVLGDVWNGSFHDQYCLMHGRAFKSKERAELESKKRQYFQEMRIAATKDGHCGAYIMHENYPIVCYADHGLTSLTNCLFSYGLPTFKTEYAAGVFIASAQEKYTEEELMSFYNIYKGAK